jgi:hypothetical protein
VVLCLFIHRRKRKSSSATSSSVRRLIQYDFGRQFPNEFKRKSAIEDSLGRANPEIRGFLNRLQTRPTRRRWITKLAELARSSSFQKQARTAEYPGASLDRLFEASYTHQHRPHMDCDRCHDNHEVCSQSCDALGCEEGKTIIRNRHVFPQAEDLASLPFGTPFVHLGRFWVGQHGHEVWHGS